MGKQPGTWANTFIFVSNEIVKICSKPDKIRRDRCTSYFHKSK